MHNNYSDDKQWQVSSALKRQKVIKVSLYILLVILVFISIFPIYWMVITSFKYPQDVFSQGINLFPKRVTLENYQKLFESLNIWRCLLNSAIISVLGTMGVLLISTLTGFGLSKFKFWGNDIVFLLVLATMAVPSTIMMVPMFRIIANLHLLNTYEGVLLPEVLGTWSGLGIFFMRQYISTLPDELIEAARLDGAGYFRIFWQIILPLIKPAIGTIGIVSFMGFWNDYIWPALVLRSPNMWTLMVALPLIKTSQFNTPWAVFMAGSTIGVIPMIITFVAFADMFIASLTLGAIKE